MMTRAPTTRRRSWWWSRKRARRRSNNNDEDDDDDALQLPNFLADANKLFDVLEIKEGNEGGRTSEEAKDLIVTGSIDARIDSLSGLFRPRRSSPLRCSNAMQSPQHHYDGKHRPPMRTRATDMTDEQLADWVLKGACSESFLRPREKKKEQPAFGFGGGEVSSPANCEISDKGSTFTPAGNNNDEVMKRIDRKHASRREQLRGMAVELHANHRMRMLGMEGHIVHPNNIDGDDTAQNNVVRIDRYGRIVRGRSGSPNRGRGNDENNNHSNNDGNDQAEVMELEDASETFWRDRSMAETRRRNELYGNKRGRMQRLNPPAVQPRPPMIGNQPVRIRDISRQMDRDARDAIQRALDRYKLQEEEAGIPPDSPGENAGQPVFELVHIPLTDPVDENNEQGGQLSRRNGDPQRQARDHQDGRDNNRNNNGQDGNPGEHPNRQAERNGAHWLDARVATRRICYAVVTVAAAFICLFIQGLPLDFRDDTRLDVDDWLSGLLVQSHQYRDSHVHDGAHVLEIPEKDDEEDDELSSYYDMFRAKKTLQHLPSDVYTPSDTAFNLQEWNHLVGLSNRNREELERLQNAVDQSRQHVSQFEEGGVGVYESESGF